MSSRFLKGNLKSSPRTYPELDVTDFEQARKFIRERSPDWVIHMAALTDLDFCEEQPDIADEVNHNGTRNIAKICAEQDSRLVYISTSGIFSGKNKNPYSESDLPKPKNVYGVSKYRGELAVRELLPLEQWMIIRAGWLFGGGAKDIKFVGKIYKLCHERDELSAVNDIFGSPNYTLDIGRLLMYLIINENTGVFHAGNSGIATRYDIARAIVDFADVECRVNPVSSDAFPTIAPRPPMEAIRNNNLASINYEMRHWEKALKEYINRLKCELQY
ncbi:MAG TPA: NAD(P)-dependent oxidoreductase [candidate division Zixibacteria bacterium]|nr:NAD(P)-dependent oxidoreductase [candidate division Zixibacteria bacterium]